MTARMRVVIGCALLAAGAAGCGQQGPLVLPEDTRPIERVDSAATEPEQNDDERRDER
jgi:predicted small lipoprotein YifL